MVGGPNHICAARAGSSDLPVMTSALSSLSSFLASEPPRGYFPNSGNLREHVLVSASLCLCGYTLSWVLPGCRYQGKFALKGQLFPFRDCTER